MWNKYKKIPKQTYYLGKYRIIKPNQLYGTEISVKKQRLNNSLDQKKKDEL